MKTLERNPVPASKANGWRVATAVVAVLLCCFIFYMSSIPGSGLPSNLGFWTTVAHFCEYAALGFFVVLSLRNGKRGFWMLVLVTVVFCSLYGASDEFHQWFVPGRNTDPLDWLTDTVGAFCGSCVAAWLAGTVSRHVARSDIG